MDGTFYFYALVETEIQQSSIYTTKHLMYLIKAVRKMFIL